jgi:hypothetical protein
MLHRKLRRLGALGAVAAAALVVAAPAGAKAKTYEVSGAQIPVDESAGTFKMTGGLVGDWAITSYTEIAKAPIYKAKGTEKFSGCLDRGRDGSCAGDPSGTLRFSIRYWAQFTSTGATVWGACYHPITGGTGDFKDAAGVLVMADTPHDDGSVTTAYIGSVTLKGAKARAKGHSRARAASLGAGTTCGS